MFNLRCRINHGRMGFRSTILPGVYCRLKVDGCLWMSDTPYERRTNADVIRHAHGDVLIHGLGLGMVVAGLIERPDDHPAGAITSITVVEIDPDVVALVGTMLPADPRVKIVLGDARSWRPPRGTRFDTVWADIWEDVCSDNLEDIARLVRRARALRRSPDSWVGAWERDTARSLA